MLLSLSLEYVLRLLPFLLTVQHMNGLNRLDHSIKSYGAMLQAKATEFHRALELQEQYEYSQGCLNCLKWLGISLLTSTSAGGKALVDIISAHDCYTFMLFIFTLNLLWSELPWYMGLQQRHLN